MGNSTYCSNTRSARASAKGYDTGTIQDIFTQQKVRQIHSSMDPKGIGMRECCDSLTHPNTVPIILGLDVTGSMLKIPHNLIKDGLPKMMSGLIQKGVPDASLLFLGIGDHECDEFPLQVGQFESGDAELDMWLTRTYLESGGGGNMGESYLLAWYFAAFHTRTDAFDKRGEKGFLITIGDEPNLKHLSPNAVLEIIGSTPSTNTQALSSSKLLALAQQKYEVFHIAVSHTTQGKNSVTEWKNTLGQNCIEVSDYADIPDVITTLVSERVATRPVTKSIAAPTPVTA